MILRIIFLQLFISISLLAATITLNKTSYTPGEFIEITLSDMPGNSGDWVGVYPKDASNDWANILTWKHDGQVANGTYNLDGIAVGDYEARVFLDNSYQLLTKISFKVEAAVNNTTIVTSQEQYNVGEPIVVTLANMPLLAGDWIGVFEKDKASTWANVLTWKHDGAVVDDTYTLDSLPAGEYQARAFLNNSYTVLATDDFSVADQAYNTTITTTKTQYDVGEPIVVTLANMPLLAGDWIGVFEKDKASTWANVLTWKHDGTVVDGEYTLDALPIGEYQARAFLNNSYTVLATDDFSVVEKQLHTTITTNKTTYINGEKITVTLADMLGNGQDWVGIFPAGSENDMNKIVIWKRTAGIKNGNLELSGIAAGNYDVRAFFNDSLEVKATTAISVTYQALQDTVYEDAGDGTTAGWTTLEGSKQVENRTLYGNKVIYVPHDWRNVNGEMVNHTLYEFKNSDGSYWDNAVQKVLQADIHPYYSWGGGAACFDFGVRAQTLLGERIILMSVWYGNKNFQATKTEYSENWVELVYPITRDLVFKNKQQYVKIDLQQKLEILEPGNKILMIKSYITSGGNMALDNIRLSSE